MSKLERLMNLTAALLETERPLTAEEIRQRISAYGEPGPTFRRSFERDKDDLREMGIPISMAPIPGSDPQLEGYRIYKSDYYLDDPGLEPDELAALHLAASAVQLDESSGIGALRKLGGVVGESGDRMASLPADPHLPVFFRAVSERRVATFRYRGTERQVEPHRLDCKRGRWYLSGFDRSKDDERHFRLDRVESDVALSDTKGFSSTDRVRGVRLHAWELGDEPERVARLLIDPDQAEWAINHVGPAAETLEDGSVILELRVSNEAALRGLVLSFLDHAEVLDPPELRANLVAWLEELAS